MAFADYTIRTPVQFVHDRANDNDLPIDALVASDDCFITLATQLDAALHDPAAQPALIEETVRTLLYLQRHYQIIKKQPNYRQ